MNFGNAYEFIIPEEVLGQYDIIYDWGFEEELNKLFYTDNSVYYMYDLDDKSVLFLSNTKRSYKKLLNLLDELGLPEEVYEKYIDPRYSKKLKANND